MPLTSGSRRETGTATRATAAIFINQVKISIEPALETVARLYKLTGAEARVLQAIVDIGGVPDSAAALGISASTVRTISSGCSTRQARIGKRTSSSLPPRTLDDAGDRQLFAAREAARAIKRFVVANGKLGFGRGSPGRTVLRGRRVLDHHETNSTIVLTGSTVKRNINGIGASNGGSLVSLNNNTAQLNSTNGVPTSVASPE